MNDQSSDKERGFLSRWSTRKLEAKRGGEVAETPVSPSTVGHAAGQSSLAGAAVPPATTAPPAPLPDVSTLTTESDFSVFMRDDVAPALRNLAVKKLFTDPCFNVMDGLDTYVDDYGYDAPLPQTWIDKMARLEAEAKARLNANQEVSGSIAIPVESSTPSEGSNTNTTPETTDANRRTAQTATASAASLPEPTITPNQALDVKVSDPTMTRD